MAFGNVYAVEHGADNNKLVVGRTLEVVPYELEMIGKILPVVRRHIDIPLGWSCEIERTGAGCALIVIGFECHHRRKDAESFRRSDRSDTWNRS